MVEIPRDCSDNVVPFKFNCRSIHSTANCTKSKIRNANVTILLCVSRIDWRVTTSRIGERLGACRGPLVRGGLVMWKFDGRPVARGRPAVRRRTGRMPPWYADAKYRMNSLRGDISSPTEINCWWWLLYISQAEDNNINIVGCSALYNGGGGGGDGVTLTIRRPRLLLWRCTAASCAPGTTAACPERDGIPFPVTTTAVATDRTATRRPRHRHGTPPFADTAPDPPTTRPAVAVWPAVLSERETRYHDDDDNNNNMILVEWFATI